jgi:hypothetical protein
MRSDFEFYQIGMVRYVSEENALQILWKCITQYYSVAHCSIFPYSAQKLTRQACTYNVILWPFRDHCSRGKAMSIAYWYACACVCMWAPGRVGVCVRIRACSLDNPTCNARMRHIMTSFVAPRSPSHLSTLSHKRCNLREKVIYHKMRVFVFSTTFV